MPKPDSKISICQGGLVQILGMGVVETWHFCLTKILKANQPMYISSHSKIVVLSSLIFHTIIGLLTTPMTADMILHLTSEVTFHSFMALTSCKGLEIDTLMPKRESIAV